MAYKFSRKAEEDLEVLTAHGIEQFGVAQAKRYYLGLIEALEFLSTYPQAAKARPELGRTTRGHPYRSHMIFYRPDDGDILIQRIRHGREDWLADATE